MVATPTPSVTAGQAEPLPGDRQLEAGPGHPWLPLYRPQLRPGILHVPLWDVLLRLHAGGLVDWWTTTDG